MLEDEEMEDDFEPFEEQNLVCGFCGDRLSELDYEKILENGSCPHCGEQMSTTFR